MGIAQELKVGLSQGGYKLLRQVEYASMPLIVMMFSLYLGDILNKIYSKRFTSIWGLACGVILGTDFFD